MTRIEASPKEQELVAQLKSNSRGAFEYLYDHYSPALYGIIVKIVKDEEKAADVLQETFLKIWRNIASYQPEKGSVFTWMLNVARNTAIDNLRADHKLSKVVALDVISDVDLTSAGASHQHTNSLDVRNWVARLLPDRRVLIEMVYFQGYTHEEAAEMLSIPLGTVKSRVRKGLQELRSVFEVPETRLKFA